MSFAIKAVHFLEIRRILFLLVLGRKPCSRSGRGKANFLLRIPQGVESISIRNFSIFLSDIKLSTFIKSRLSIHHLYCNI